MRYSILILAFLFSSLSGANAKIHYTGSLDTDATFSLDKNLKFDAYDLTSSPVGVEKVAEPDHGGYDDYWDEDYDDFRFSRRLRRFHRRNSVRNSWSYYDPFFTSDIYFVLGTPYWNRWNRWYDPFAPRIVSRSWFGGLWTTTRVYTSGWNPYGYDPFCYDGGGFNDFGYSYNYGYGSSFGFDQFYSF